MKRIFLLFLLWFPLYSHAQRFATGNTITISKEVNEDLYIVGNTIIINAPIHGDLIVMGGTIVVNDSVNYDVIALGGQLTLNGVIGDDVRCVGGRVYVNKKVDGDLVSASGEIHIAKAAQIEGSSMISGGKIIVDGWVKGWAKIMAGSLTFNGIVGKSLEANGGELIVNGKVDGVSKLSAQDLEIGSGAVFNNRVNYWSERKLIDKNKILEKKSAVEDSSLKPIRPDNKYLGFASFMGLIWYLSAAFIFIILIEYLFGNFLQTAASGISLSITRSIGYGALFFILVPVFIIISLVTIIGIPLGLLLMVLFIILTLLSSIITSAVLANWVNVYYYRNRKLWRQIWTALLIFVILQIIVLIPVAGWLLVMAMVLLAFGAIILNIRMMMKSRRVISDE